jgi:hypothetical protein
MSADETGSRTAGFWGIRLEWLVISNSASYWISVYESALQSVNFVWIELRELLQSKP